MLKSTRPNFPTRIWLRLFAAMLIVYAAAWCAGGGAPLPAAAGRIFPSPFSPDAIWFYDRDMQKIIPEIDTGWLTVVFQPDPSAPGKPMDEKALTDAAKRIMDDSNLITARFLAPERAENACFFRIAEGASAGDLRELAAAIAGRDDVRYTHPALRIDGKTFAFLDTFDMQWKTGLDSGLKSRILAQADAVADDGEGACRVDVFKRPFFEAVNLLAEDVHVRWAVPRIVALEPLCSVAFDTAIAGGRVGDEIPFVVTVRFSEQVRIDPSAVNEFGIMPAGISSELFDVTVDAEGAAAAKSPIRIRGRITFFAPGVFVIPPVVVPYVCDGCPGAAVGSAASPERTVKVASMIPPASSSGEAAPKLLLPDGDPEPPFTASPEGIRGRADMLQAIAGFMAAAACFGYAIHCFRASRRRKPCPASPGVPDLLASELRKLLEEPPSCHWRYMATVGRTLRRFLSEEYALTGNPWGGTGRIFADAARSRMPDALAETVRRALCRIDDAVSAETDAYPEMGAFKAEVRRILDFRED